MSAPFDETRETIIRVSIRGGSTQSAPYGHLEGTLAGIKTTMQDMQFREMLKQVAIEAARFEKVYTDERARMDSLAANGTLGKPDGASKEVDVKLPFSTDVKTCKHGVMTKAEAGGKVGYVCKLEKKDPARCPSIML
jgi:hypothetical protein